MTTGLKVGESVQVYITKNLTYTVTNDGWTLRVSSTKALAVKPNVDGSVQIVCLGQMEDDEL